jgi:hypothetical protein
VGTALFFNGEKDRDKGKNNHCQCTYAVLPVLQEEFLFSGTVRKILPWGLHCPGKKLWKPSRPFMSMDLLSLFSGTKTYILDL